ncbi:MAG: hypothetical protein JNL75_07420 [Chitinophagales bacterium]|nr:hypothetical protein [Chitinophagales bacterium]
MKKFIILFFVVFCFQIMKADFADGLGEAIETLVYLIIGFIGIVVSVVINFFIYKSRKRQVMLTNLMHSLFAIFLPLFLLIIFPYLYFDYYCDRLSKEINIYLIIIFLANFIAIVYTGRRLVIKHKEKIIYYFKRIVFP